VQPPAKNVTTQINAITSTRDVLFHNTSKIYLFVEVTLLVIIGAFVIPAGGVLTIISLVDGTAPDTALVEAEVFDELFPQPAAASMAVPNTTPVK
jgi:hypothetical protein